MASGSINGAVASVSNENALVVVDYPFGKPPTRRTTVWTVILAAYKSSEVLDLLPDLEPELWELIFTYLEPDIAC